MVVVVLVTPKRGRKLATRLGNIEKSRGINVFFHQTKWNGISFHLFWNGNHPYAVAFFFVSIAFPFHSKNRYQTSLTKNGNSHSFNEYQNTLRVEWLIENERWWSLEPLHILVFKNSLHVVSEFKKEVKVTFCQFDIPRG